MLFAGLHVLPRVKLIFNPAFIIKADDDLYIRQGSQTLHAALLHIKVLLQDHSQAVLHYIVVSKGCPQATCVLSLITFSLHRLQTFRRCILAALHQPNTFHQQQNSTTNPTLACPACACSHGAARCVMS